MINTERLADELELLLRDEGYTQVIVCQANATQIAKDRHDHYAGVTVVADGLKYDMLWMADVNCEAEYLLPLALDWLAEHGIDPKRKA